MKISASCLEWFQLKVVFLIHSIFCLFVENEEDSPGGKTICEMKFNGKDHGAENQAIAQTIVFSYI